MAGTRAEIDLSDYGNNIDTSGQDPYVVNGDRAKYDEIRELFTDQEIEDQINRIKNNPEWMEKLVEEADERNYDLTLWIERNALWFLNEKHGAKRRAELIDGATSGIDTDKYLNYGLILFGLAVISRMFGKR